MNRLIPRLHLIGYSRVVRIQVVSTCIRFTCVSHADTRLSYRISVRPSVRPSVPSVTRWHCIKRAEHIVMLSSPHNSRFILVLCVYKIFAKFRRGHPLRAINRCGVWKCHLTRRTSTRLTMACGRGVQRWCDLLHVWRFWKTITASRVCRYSLIH